MPAGDYVGEVKLFLFIKEEEVASRPPHRGAVSNLKKRRKRRPRSLSSKRRKGPTDKLPAGNYPADGMTAVDGAIKYNTVQGYCST